MRTFVGLAVALALLLAACGDDAETSGSATTASTTREAVTTGATTTTVAPDESTTTPTEPAACDDAAMFEIVDQLSAEARLAPGEWVADVETPFDDRTNTAAVFGDRLAFDCSVRATQTTADGGTRLLVAAWTFPRYGFVLQSTDAPSAPYEPIANFQLLYEETRGEYIDDQTVWAATMSGGESILVAAQDYGLGPVAKAWQSAFPALPDAEITHDAQDYGIGVLDAAGMHGATTAEPPAPGNEIVTLYFDSPTAQTIIATVAPEDWLDPSVPVLTGETRTERVGGVDVRVTAPGPDDLYDVGDVGWTCDGYAWRLTGGFGTVDELFEVAQTIIESVGC